MSNNLVITLEERNELNKILRSFGLRIDGGSIDYENEKAWIGIYCGSAATYNKPRVAAMMANAIGVGTIVLDSQEFVLPA